MKIGRNDPCPCGSGKKYKKCCMSPAEKLSDELRDLIDDQNFNSIEEAQAFANNHMRQRNQMPSDDFSGLSPEQMYQILNLPFDCPDLVFFPDSIKTLPDAPLQKLFDLIISAIGTDGLKATAKGNLPQKFCRESALTFRGSAQSQEKIRFGSINKEEESFRRCFTYRTITRFMQFLGLTELEKIPTDLPYRYEFRLKTLPLLNEVVKFPLDSTHIQNADLTQ